MKNRTKKTLSYIFASAVIIGAAVWTATRFMTFGHVEFTDNAQIRQQIVPVNSRVQGFIKEIRFKEYGPVKKGDTLVIIDDSDLRVRVAQARAGYQAALAAQSVTDKNATAASANVSVSEASVQEARIVMENAKADYLRYKALLAQDAVTKQQYDGMKTDYEAKNARYETLARQQNAAGSAAIAVRQGLTVNEANIEVARAALEAAELDMSYTVVLAPCDGVASRLEIQTGQLVQTGQTLLDIVDTGDTWLTANYKETQLKHILPGSEVQISVDAIPDVTYYGKVVSISNATGSSLSILPQDNSAGNFVKVRQRIPIRIEFTDKNSKENMAALRAGMNVECKIPY